MLLDDGFSGDPKDGTAEGVHMYSNTSATYRVVTGAHSVDRLSSGTKINLRVSTGENKL